MRLRLFDLNTPWFWIVMFYQDVYSKPYIELLIYGSQTWRKFWFHFYKWEATPSEIGKYAIEELETK